MGAYSFEMIDGTELVLLNDLYKSKNSDIQHWRYEIFDLEELNHSILLLLQKLYWLIFMVFFVFAVVVIFSLFFLFLFYINIYEKTKTIIQYLKNKQKSKVRNIKQKLNFTQHSPQSNTLVVECCT